MWFFKSLSLNCTINSNLFVTELLLLLLLLLFCSSREVDIIFVKSAINRLISYLLIELSRKLDIVLFILV